MIEIIMGCLNFEEFAKNVDRATLKQRITERAEDSAKREGRSAPNAHDWAEGARMLSDVQVEDSVYYIVYGALGGRATFIPR